MAIDKMIPRFLVSDEDERLLKEGAMTDALNVTISEDGNGSEGVVKNVKGTIAGTAIAGSELAASNAVTVIGQVSDPQRSKIYFFVADSSATGDFSNGTEHAVYQYDTASDTYKVVLKDGWLKFNPDGFVKADVLNGSFQQDGVIQTILYFTDNLNEPRKINVDRALTGDYDGYNDRQLDYALSVIKASCTTPPSFYFETNTSLSSNNLIGKSFQFATQLIYKDGEESAMSSYSSLAFPSFYPEYGLNEAVFESTKENVCSIDLGFIHTDILDVEGIRVMGRIGNSGSFFLIDEVKTNISLQRDVFGSTELVYDHHNGIYKFYNDGVYPSVDTLLVDKNYDNVPTKAEGQALVGNRLMYSNYVEGKDSVSASASLTVEYQDPLSNSQDDNTSVVGYATSAANGDIKIDLSSISWPTDNGVAFVPAGTIVSFEFDYEPEGSIKSNGGSPGFVEMTSGLGMKFRLGFNGGTYNNGIPIVGTQNPLRFVHFVETNVQLTLSGLRDLIKSSLENSPNASRQLTYDVPDNAAEVYIPPNANGNFPVDPNANGGQAFLTTADIYSNDPAANNDLSIGTIDVSNLNVTLNYEFDEIANVGSTALKIKPYVSSVVANTATISSTLFNNNSAQFGSTFSTSIVGSFGLSQTSGQTTSSQGSATYDITNTTAYLTEQDSYTNISLATSSFKSGSSHPLGVVYYDIYGRHGFVNELGSVYVNGLWERIAPNATEKGPASINIDFTSSMPDWAESYQIVYSGPSAYDSFIVNAVSIGEEASGTDVNSGNQIYVSLKPLELFNENSSSKRSYSFTEGDKLRVVFRTEADSSLTYKTSNSGGAMEFDIVGTVENPVDSIIHASASADELHSGTWLILKAPVISGGGSVGDVDADSTLDNLQYEGYDYYSITNTAYPLGDPSSNTNLWESGTMVEIVSPKKTLQDKVYYEIGERRSRPKSFDALTETNHGGDFSISNGSVWWRNVTFSVPGLPVGTPHTLLSNYTARTYYIECETPSEITDSKDWHKGRPHVAFKSAAEIRRENGITYSDAYAEDVSKLSLSSFTPSLANFDSLEGSYGAARYIGSYNDNLAVLQENKLSLIPVGKNIIEYAGGSSNVAISSEVLGQARYASGDYGCGGHPEAVLIQDNDVFFVDESRQAVMRLGGDQLTPISEKNMSSFFEDFFTNSHTRYVSGYDPRISTYFITGLGGTAETVGYDVARGVWQSKYSFTPDVYANQNNMLYSAKYVGTNAFWRHDDDVTPNRNTFYGTAYPSEVETVSKTSPSRVKVYNSMSYEGDSASWNMDPGVETDLGQLSGTITSWSEREGSYYAAMPRDTSSNSTSQKIYLGILGPVVFVNNKSYYASNIRLSRLSIPLGVTLSIGGVDVVVSEVIGNQIAFEGNFQSFAGSQHLSLSSDNGDPIRGHYAKIKLTNSSNAKHELYCINTHITDSKSHHPLGQQ